MSASIWDRRTSARILLRRTLLRNRATASATGLALALITFWLLPGWAFIGIAVVAYAILIVAGVQPLDWDDEETTVTNTEGS